ncbi:ABC transporter ATP-binding protein [Desulfobacula phenolica]|uniref:Spermidine/putrescine import ATP-binding protein PotA n=1 Tax=Desulfobacula phenolica TaxID=90732 RepID=A0A1H2ILU2_9BACT|nr:ABC transporter ATP-binding protein [Desulfobacula phenolica]SDU45127.1 iron(III) transport system ATP-binding protein [Desulfobacula phenolica]
MKAVVLKNVEKSFNGTMACADISLSINRGEFFTFLGPSGCGKTTILRLIAGFIRPDKGKIFLKDKDITHLAPEKRKVGMVFQNYALFPFMSVSENIAYGLKIQKRPEKEIQEKLETYIAMVGMDGFEDRNIAELSGGEQQRVALARSLAIEPAVLLLDEPLSNLDARLRDRMRLEIKSLQKRLGITTIFVTHDQTEALTMSDRIAVFNKGRCIQTGTPEDIYANPVNSFVAKFIGDTNLFAVDMKNGNPCVCNDLLVRLNRPVLAQSKFISIRPQDIILSKKSDKKSNTFKGRVEDIQLNGTWIEYCIKVKGIDFKATALNTTANKLNITIFDDIYVSFETNSLKILDN